MLPSDSNGGDVAMRASVSVSLWSAIDNVIFLKIEENPNRTQQTQYNLEQDATPHFRDGEVKGRKDRPTLSKAARAIPH